LAKCPVGDWTGQLVAVDIFISSEVVIQFAVADANLLLLLQQHTLAAVQLLNSNK
jgi:hypothetical protein